MSIANLDVFKIKMLIHKPFKSFQRNFFFSIYNLSTKRAKSGDKLNVLCIAEDQAFLNATLPQAVLYLRGDVDKSSASWDFEKQFFAVGFYGMSSRGIENCFLV